MSEFRLADEAAEEILAFLGLTYEIDLWSHEVPTSLIHLSECDQDVLSELYVSYLMPTARSIWWQPNYYGIKERLMVDKKEKRATTKKNGVVERKDVVTKRLLGKKYPLLENKAWRQCHAKASKVLRIWRKDLSRLFPELRPDDYVPEDELADESADELAGEDEVTISTSNRGSKRKAEAAAEPKPKKLKTITAAPPKSPHESKPVWQTSTPSQRCAISFLITPPQSGGNSPVLGDLDDFDDTDDEAPLPMGRRRGCPVRTLERTPPPISCPPPSAALPIRAMFSKPGAALKQEPDTSEDEDEDILPMGRRRGRPIRTLERTTPAISCPLTTTNLPIRAISSKPVEAPKKQDPAKPDDEIEFVSKAVYEAAVAGRQKTERKIKKLGKKIKSLSKMIEKLNEDIQA
ncbi:hypothetical protein K456DRAFT_1720867 [Colletotrichum gloeosporioides 23]|nr:hypothetical protein K456DRAFT_1720867 [Colletotrichum gloeosporioides 23]KAJ0285599.1 hypothetical protein COL940_003444 [Colletotrichum noveboracense]KAJ0288728.1 hypothetical protein CBS470a_004717 [Colletotrichum nupharicola]KAJ0318701.1 hypothetical protein Brms1b_004190 [Colletotrichum noveboracense]